MQKSYRRIILFTIIGVIGLCLVLAGYSAWTNRSLPTHSQTTDRLSDLEKARLAEAFHLRLALGNTVWPGWGSQDIPIIVYNEAYAFLVGYSDPPGGWVRMPQREPRGSAWEVVPGDPFVGQVYYRQRLPDPEITPENFTVLVGERWVVTMMTREYAEVAFYADISQEMPSALSGVFPYRLAWGLIMGDTETYLGGLEHEAFHAFQGTLAEERLKDAEMANATESQYPWDDAALDKAWKREMDLLVQAVRAPTDAQSAELARQFLAQRDVRRSEASFNPELVEYEQQREWLEGLAKYAELTIQRLAATTPGYIPLPAMAADPAFKAYSTREKFWSGQIDETRRTAGRAGETRFYYSGMAQAVVLDRLLPNWKERALDPDVMLEALLRLAAKTK